MTSSFHAARCGPASVGGRFSGETLPIWRARVDSEASGGGSAPTLGGYAQPSPVAPLLVTHALAATSRGDPLKIKVEEHDASSRAATSSSSVRVTETVPDITFERLEPSACHQISEGEGPVLEAEVCIVGAGMAGLSTAYFLAKQGVNVVVIEDGEVGLSFGPFLLS
jgi:hypothetical protein